MKNFNLLASTAIAASLLFAAPALAAIDISVTETLAPNAYGSPSWAGWAQNAIDGQLAGTSAGTPGTPTYFQAQSNVTAEQAVATGFNSWDGVVNPAAPYGSELGERMHFAVLINGNGEQFSVSNLSFVMDSDDPGNALGWTWGAGHFTYNQQSQGILFGGDGHLGGGDDTFITGGANTQLVDAFVSVGSGNALAAYCAGCDAAASQAALNDAAGYFTQPVTHFNGTYTLGSATGSGTFNISGAVPEPSSWALMILGFGGLGGVMRKRRAMAKTAFA